MNAGEILEEILGTAPLSAEDINFLLGKIDVSAQPCKCKVLFYKSVEKALLCHYKKAYGIDLLQRIYSMNEIHGLMLFLYIKKYGVPEVDQNLETFFEGLFFSDSGEIGIKDLREESERLATENMELKERINEMSNSWMDKVFEEEFKSVDSEVLSKMEKDLIVLKEQVDFEHSAIMEAWYKLGEEYIRNRS